MTVSVVILTHDACWKGLRPTVRRAVEKALAHRNMKNATVTLVLTNDAEIRALNHAYRGKDKPTNVLSFPNDAQERGVRHLGDIVLGYETLAAEAAMQSKSFKHHLTHVTIHGTLHLLGFDHETEPEAEAMEALEIEILNGMGIANPYETA